MKGGVYRMLTLHDGIFAVQPFGQVGNCRYGGLRVQFIGLLGKG